MSGASRAIFPSLIAISRQSTDVLFGILYGWFALFGLFWVQPFATVTVRRNGWLTRG